MKVYVDEMPKNCKNCSLCQKDDLGYWCNAWNDRDRVIYISDKNVNNKRLPSCPLHSLSTHDQQVRADEKKKVVEEIRQQAFKHFNIKDMQEYEKLPLIDSLFTMDTVTDILAQVEKGGKQ